MEVKAIGMRREGNRVVLEIELPDLTCHQIGQVDLSDSFSAWWNLDTAKPSIKERKQLRVVLDDNLRSSNSFLTDLNL